MKMEKRRRQCAEDEGASYANGGSEDGDRRVGERGGGRLDGASW